MLQRRDAVTLLTGMQPRNSLQSHQAGLSRFADISMLRSEGPFWAFLPNAAPSPAVVARYSTKVSYLQKRSSGSLAVYRASMSGESGQTGRIPSWRCIILCAVGMRRP